jgi:hypothetical protein
MKNKFLTVSILYAALVPMYSFATSAQIDCVCTSYRAEGGGDFSQHVESKASSPYEQVTASGEKYISTFSRPDVPNTLGFWLASGVFDIKSIALDLAKCKDIEASDPSLSACALVVPPLSRWTK